MVFILLNINKMRINKIKGILSLISAILIHLLIGNLFSFPNFITYYHSYLECEKNAYNETESVSINQLNFIAPTGILVHNTLPSVTGFLDNKLGTRVLTIIGSISLLGSNLIMYYFTDYYLMIISYFLFGFCGSLTYFQSLKNCWKYFPDKKGLISGIVFSCFGLSAFIFTSLGDFIINPNGEKAKDKIYECKIAYNFLKYLKFYIICIIIMGTLSSILCFTYKEDNDINNEEEETILTNEKGEEKYSVVLKEDNKENSKNLTLKESLYSINFLSCLTIAGCTLIFGFLLTTTYRTFGTKQELDEKGLQILSKFFTLLNTFSRLLWGIICDKFGFKIPYIIVCINQLICGILIYFSSSNIYTYFIVVCFGVLSYSGHIILFPNLIHNKFGVENSVILLGICGIFAGISSMVGPIIISNTENFLRVYLIGVAPTIVSLIVVLFIKVEKLDKVNEILPQVSESDKIVDNNLTRETYDN